MRKTIKAMKMVKQPKSSHRTVHILCDSTGNLPRHMMAALATQFPPGVFATREWTFIRSMPQLQQVQTAVEADPGILVHAFVSEELKRGAEAFCRKAGIPCRDLTGGLVEFLSKNTGVQPTSNAERLHEMDEIYHSRVKAIEFALSHDDGLGLDSIHEADVVIVGVSRTGKTPTSVYLAQQGHRAANVSLALEVEPPQQLLKLSSGRVVGLTIEPTRLLEIRTRRQIEWGMTPTAYNDPKQVQAEIDWARALFRRRGWPTLDVTHQAVEETAAKIIEIISRSRSIPAASVN